LEPEDLNFKYVIKWQISSDLWGGWTGPNCKLMCMLSISQTSRHKNGEVKTAKGLFKKANRII